MSKNQVQTMEGASLISNPYSDHALTVSQNAPHNMQGGGMVSQGASGTDSQRAIAEVQAQAVVARQYPRNPLAATDKILAESQRRKFAESALYSFARGGSNISGLSIRALEMCARNWTNMRYGFRVLSRSKDGSEVQAYAYDMESNVPVERVFYVRHWRDTKQGGYLLTDERDIYELIANQAQRRVRACLEALLPADVLEACENQIKETLHATADVTPEGIKKLVDTFAKYGITSEAIEARIQRKIQAIEAAQVVDLRKIYNSIKDGMSKPSDWFENVTEEKPQPDMKKKVAEKAAPKKEPEPKPEPKDESPLVSEDMVDCVAMTTGEVYQMTRAEYDALLPEERPKLADSKG